MTKNLLNPPNQPTRLHIFAYPGASQAAILGLGEMFDAANRFGKSGAFRVTIGARPPGGDIKVALLPPAYGNELYLNPDAAIVA